MNLEQWAERHGLELQSYTERGSDGGFYIRRDLVEKILKERQGFSAKVINLLQRNQDLAYELLFYKADIDERISILQVKRQVENRVGKSVSLTAAIKEYRKVTHG